MLLGEINKVRFKKILNIKIKALQIQEMDIEIKMLDLILDKLV